MIGQIVFNSGGLGANRNVWGKLGMKLAIKRENYEPRISYNCFYVSHLSVSLGIITTFVLQRLKTTSIQSPNGKLVLQSTYPTLKCFFEKGQKLYFIIHVFFTIYPCLLYLLKNFTHGMLHHTN